MLPLGILVMGDPVPLTLEKRGDFARLFQQSVGSVWTDPWVVVDARVEQRLPAAADLAGLIVTGSAASVLDAEPWVLTGLAYLKAIVEAKVPVLGVCFGHQMLAQALGGRVERNPRGREMGTVELSLHSDDPIIHDAQRPYQVNMSHVDSVVQPPRGAQVLGRTERDPHAALRFSENAWGVQFHPEFDKEIIGHYAHTRAESLREEGFDPDQVQKSATDAHAGAGVLKRFVEVAVRGRA